MAQQGTEGVQREAARRKSSRMRASQAATAPPLTFDALAEKIQVRTLPPHCVNPLKLTDAIPSQPYFSVSFRAAADVLRSYSMMLAHHSHSGAGQNGVFSRHACDFVSVVC